MTTTSDPEQDHKLEMQSVVLVLPIPRVTPVGIHAQDHVQFTPPIQPKRPRKTARKMISESAAIYKQFAKVEIHLSSEERLCDNSF